jgi:hypothetical protein
LHQHLLGSAEQKRIPSSHPCLIACIVVPVIA